MRRVIYWKDHCLWLKLSALSNFQNWPARRNGQFLNGVSHLKGIVVKKKPASHYWFEHYISKMARPASLKKIPSPFPFLVACPIFPSPFPFLAPLRVSRAPNFPLSLPLSSACHAGYDFLCERPGLAVQFWQVELSALWFVFMKKSFL